MDDYITANEAAKLIGCVDSRIRQLLRDKKLTGKKMGRDWLIERASAEAYKNTERKPGPKAGADPKRKRKPKG